MKIATTEPLRSSATGTPNNFYMHRDVMRRMNAQIQKASPHGS